ncbi:MAG: cellulase family glycosylhydrolase [bacterium]|nr:cellulase family glycosylhydrolase [bacterium]
MKKTILLLFLAAASASGRDLPFRRGVNLADWFQRSSASEIHVNRFTQDDFNAIRNLGCDHVRLPVDLLNMAGSAPAYELDPLFLRFLDMAVDRAEAAGLNLIIDNHTFDPAVDTDPAIEPVLLASWTQVARHFRNRSGLVHYEVQNEPHGISDAVWNAMQGRVIDAIRLEDPLHTIVVGGAGWNGYNNLSLIPAYADTNLIYTFHFYDPFLFTHQGASWTDPSGADIAGIPYPYDASRMPGLPASLIGTWWQDTYNDYPRQGNAAHVRSLIDIAVRFKNQRNVPLWCGEFGAYQIHSTSADRARWHAVVRGYLEEKGIAWSLWDYNGGFGMFEPGTPGNVETDVDTAMAAALGLTPPPQREPSLSPDTVGFTLYDDFIGSGLLDAGWHSAGTADWYSEDSPRAGSFCLTISDFDRYGNVAFRFSGARDLSVLVERGFELNLWARCSDPDTRVDARFEDTKTGDPDDHPWRIRTTLGPPDLDWTGDWQNIRVALRDFTEHGSWDNDRWYNPEGLFDWTAVDRLAIVAEHGPLEGVQLDLDDIRISDPDANAVRVAGDVPGRFGLLPNYPNPFNPSTTLSFRTDRPGPVTVLVFDLRGTELFRMERMIKAPGIQKMEWNGRGRDGVPLPSGIYICRIESAGRVANRRMVLIK